MRFLLLSLILALLFLRLNYAQTNAGYALSLDGNDDYLQVVHISELQFEGSFTISVWMKTNTMNNSSIIMQYECGKTCANAPSLYQIAIINEGECYFNLRDGNGVVVNIIDTLNFYNDGSWHLFTGVRDFSKNLQLLYVDGVLVGSTTAPDGIIGDDDGEEDPVVFGGRYAPRGSFIEGFFNGEIDEIRLWNVARTQEQIVATMLDTLGTAYYSTTDSGLVGYWRFDEFEDLGVNGDGIDDIRDFSVNANHADAEGIPFLIPSGALVSVERINNLVPDKYYLSQNYPNPFNPNTKIQFSNPQLSFITLEIFNILEESVGLLVSQELTAGNYNYDWDASFLPSGIYFYRLQAGGYIESKKKVLMK